MTGQDIEVGFETAKRLADSGSMVVWVKCEPDARESALLEELSSNYLSFCPDELVGNDSDAIRAIGKKPVIVCSHGVTSMYVARHLRAMQVEAYSLKGGVEGPG
jgi:hypothetical protein